MIDLVCGKVKGASLSEAPNQRKRQQTTMGKVWKWENGRLCARPSLLDSLQIADRVGEVISVVGAGGKTTTIRRLAEEAVKQKRTVAVTTSTKMKKEPQFVLTADVEKIQRKWEEEGQVWFGTPGSDREKVTGVTEQILDAVCARHPDLLLIEADGAKRLPCKVPEAWEPVIYPKSTRVLAVYGLDAVGETFEKVCCRPELAAELLKKNITDQISAQDIARLAKSRQGGRKNVNKSMGYQVILNKADTSRKRWLAEEICRELEKEGVTEITVTAEGRQEAT